MEKPYTCLPEPTDGGRITKSLEAKRDGFSWQQHPILLENRARRKETIPSRGLNKEITHCVERKSAPVPCDQQTAPNCPTQNVPKPARTPAFLSNTWLLSLWFSSYSVFFSSPPPSFFGSGDPFYVYCEFLYRPGPRASRKTGQKRKAGEPPSVTRINSFTVLQLKADGGEPTPR